MLSTAPDPVTTLPSPLRRAPCLVLFWRADALVIQNYRTGQRHEIDALTVRVLAAFEGWCELEGICERFPEFSPTSVRESLRTLHSLGLLVTPEQHEQQTLDERWGPWDEQARFFHFATRNTHFLRGEAEDAVEQQCATRPMPPPFKRYPEAPRLMLPRAFLPLSASYESVLANRRTARCFGPEPVTLRALSTLLHHSFAPMYVQQADGYGTVAMRTSASGGGRQELEAYVAVLNVEGIAPGIYHYAPVEHALELLDPCFDARRAARAVWQQDWVGDAGFVVFTAARFERLMCKYHDARAYRIALLDQGHFGQTFCLNATALSLAPFVTAALRDAEIESWLGLDGVTEAVMYAMVAGTPAESVREGLPADLGPLRPLTGPVVQEVPLPRRAPEA